MNYTPVQKFSVFGIEFDTFKEALGYAINAYAVQAEVLYNYSVEANGDLEKALKRIFAEQEELNFEKELKAYAKEFSDKYKKSELWILRSLKSLHQRYSKMTAKELSELFHQNYLGN